MTILQKDSIPDFTKMTYATWFRVPSGSDPSTGIWPMLPCLMNWGKRTTPDIPCGISMCEWNSVGSSLAWGTGGNIGGHICHCESTIPGTCWIPYITSCDAGIFTVAGSLPDCNGTFASECWVLCTTSHPPCLPANPSVCCDPDTKCTSGPGTVNKSRSWRPDSCSQDELSYISLSSLGGALGESSAVIAIYLSLTNSVPYNPASSSGNFIMLTDEYYGDFSNVPSGTYPPFQAMGFGGVGRNVLANVAYDTWHFLLVSIDISPTDTMVPATTENLGGGQTAGIGWNLSYSKRIDILLDGVVITGGTFMETVDTAFTVGADDPPIVTGNAPCAGDGPVGLPILEEEADGNHNEGADEEWGDGGSGPSSGAQPQMEFAYTQIWFDTFVDVSDPTIQSKFFTVVGDRITPPSNINAAQSAFGTSEIFLYRDKAAGIKYQDNQGSGGSLSMLGTSLSDYFPGPGQAGGFSLEQPVAVFAGAKPKEKPKQVLPKNVKFGRTETLADLDKRPEKPKKPSLHQRRKLLAPRHMRPRLSHTRPVVHDISAPLPKGKK